MAQRRRHLELCRRRGRVWLLVSDGREFSASSAAKLVELLRSLGSEDPLALNPNDRITVRRPVADFAPVLEAMRPKDTLIPLLEKKIDDSSAWPGIFDLGASVNGRRWAWLAVRHPIRRQLVPAEFIKDRPRIFQATASFTGSMTGAIIRSSVLLRDSVSLEIEHGDDGIEGWVAVRYDVTGGPWDAVLTHLRRPSMGLGGEGADVECPFCTDDPLPDWNFDIWTSREVGPGFAGVALARRYRPCEAHKAVRREVEIEGVRYVWRYRWWIEPHHLPVWRRSMAGAASSIFDVSLREDA